MPKISHFPITTTDQKATESNEGLCPALKQTIRPFLVFPEGTDSVVSEKGIRDSLDILLGELIKGENLGTGEKIFRDITTDAYHHKIFINLKTLSTHTPDAVFFTETPNGMQIDFKNVGDINVISNYVQGGSEQIWGHFFDSYNQSVPIYANMHTSLLAGLPGMDKWDTDIAIAKMGFHISKSKTFNNKDVLIWIGVEDNGRPGRILLEEPLIDNYSFLLTECGNKILI
jgi:hypothetical protein